MLCAMVLTLAAGQPLHTFLEAHCLDCHGGARPKGGLDLETLDAGKGDLESLLIWDRVRARMQARDMPPRADFRPPPENYDAALVHVEAIIDEVAAGLDDPGTPGGRRLNRTEWRNAVFDLLGVDIDIESRLPADEVGHGFDTVGDTLALSPPLLEKFIEAAELAAAAAIQHADAAVFSSVRVEGDDLSVKGAGRRGRGGIRMHSRATALGTVELPRSGRYRIVLHARGQQAGPEPVRLAIDVDGSRLGTVDVPETQSTAHSIDADLPGGRVTLGATFINDYYRPDDPDPNQRDRNAMVGALEVRGPLDEPLLSPLQAALEPELSQATTPTKARRLVRSVVRKLLPRAWRQMPTNAEIDRLVALATRSAEDVHDQLRTALTAMLAHPAFLLRLESDPEEGDVSRPLNGHEIAARMALLLWSSVPDDELLRAAWTGSLNTPAGRHEQLDRMLQDPRSKRLAEAFAPQWLQVRRVEQAHPDPKQFSGVDGPLLESMQRETIDTFDHLLRNDRPWADLVRSDETVIDARLAAHYGIDGVPDKGVHLVSRGNEGVGVLAQAGVLTATSNPTRTSPVKRGKWVLEALLDAPPPPPPPGVEPLPGDGHGDASLRAMMIEHRRNPDCATCHARMDELGFAMESFDAVGRPRLGMDDRGLPPGDAPIEGVEGLRDWVLAKGALPRSLARHMLTHAVGRGFDVRDETAIDAVAAHLVREERLSALLEAVIESRPFLERGSPAPPSP